MAHTKKGRKVALVAGLALVVLSVAMSWTYWEAIRFFLKFERLGLNEQGFPEYRHRETGIVFVGLPGGTFMMGSPETEAGREEREGPVHKYAESLPHCQPESPGAIQMSSRSAEEKSGIRSR